MTKNHQAIWSTWSCINTDTVCRDHMHTHTHSSEKSVSIDSWVWMCWFACIYSLSVCVCVGVCQCVCVFWKSSSTRTSALLINYNSDKLALSNHPPSPWISHQSHPIRHGWWLQPPIRVRQGREDTQGTLTLLRVEMNPDWTDAGLGTACHILINLNKQKLTQQGLNNYSSFTGHIKSSWLVVSSLLTSCKWLIKHHAASASLLLMESVSGSLMCRDRSL